MSAVCGRCAEPLVDPNRPCMFCIGERRENAVKKLAAAAKSGGPAAITARVDAIDTLRSLGHSKAEVLLARDQAVDGRSVGEILDGLLAGSELGAVA